MLPPPGRRVYANRTLNLRSIGAVGFDMDYTLVHYRTEQWEQRAYDHVRKRLLGLGFPVGALRFDPSLVSLGLVIDRELGNIVKASRFGWVVRACHGTRMLGFDEQRQAYSDVLVDLAEPRFSMMTTLFALSEACLYAQLVDLLDRGELPGPIGYAELYRIVRSNMDETHLFGELKPEIMAAPDFFVELDPDLPLALRDLREAGKKLLLITNSAWSFTRAMMAYAIDRYLPAGGSWRELFDLVIVSARKPSFFGTSAPVYEVVEETGLLRAHYHALEPGRVYEGGSASLVEAALGLSGAEILYVGDHVYADVEASKKVRRWRTALVLRELEAELEGLERFRQGQAELSGLMERKEAHEHRVAALRLALQRHDRGHGPAGPGGARGVRDRLGALKAELELLDERIGPLARTSAELQSERWGLLMRAGNDKSLLARQVEGHADVYTSRVSNLLHATPFAFLRAPRGSLPHDR